MGLKANIKKLIGNKNQQRIKAVKAWRKYRKTRANAGKLVMGEGWAEPVIYELPNQHLFFGYYDIQQIQGDKLLAMSVKCKADTKKDPATLYWVDMPSGEYHQIGQTRAWCWQQGSRLRWHPTQPDTVLYNDMEGERYVCRIAALDGGVKKTLPRAMYDITADGRFGLSLNYARLQRLRPGYGYNTLPDETLGEKVPQNDGIFLVDMDTGEEKLIISYERLVQDVPETANQMHYVNHISISPDGKRFLFFHLWTPTVGGRWSGRLCTANLDGTDLRCVEDGFIPSHYCWGGSDRLLITSVGFGGAASYYYQYDLTAQTKTKLENPHLVQDGHPTYLSDGVHFLTDTYPLSGSMQRLFLSNQADTPICQIYSDPRLFEEKRCDLHPRLTQNDEIITIDSTFRDGKRSVILLRRG